MLPNLIINFMLLLHSSYIVKFSYFLLILVLLNGAIKDTQFKLTSPIYFLLFITVGYSVYLMQFEGGEFDARPKDITIGALRGGQGGLAPPHP